MNTALIVSLNFRAAHVSHLVASYKQMAELGYRPKLWIAPEFIPFLPEGISYVTDISDVETVDIAIFWFPAAKNASCMRRLKKQFKTKIIYVLHEPIESFKDYKASGFSITEIIKIYAKYTFSLSFLLLSDYIILPSKKALLLYEHSFARRLNKHYKLVPLLFDDEKKDDVPRKYFSYIGTIAKDHAFSEYVDFIHNLYSKNEIPYNLNFLIATRNVVERTDKISELLNSGGLTVIEGRPLTDDEINRCYAESYCIWNAYHRTTQSGVLAKASMFGTPAIVRTENLSEFSVNGKNVAAVNENTDYESLKTALADILDNFTRYSECSREVFMSTFYYKSHNASLADIIQQL